MVNLLAIETSGAICSVGLCVDGNRFVRSEHVEKKHNERLLPMLEALREEAGLSRPALLDAIDTVAFGRGPGSFTGVRIAAAAAQAVALTAGANIVRVSSSEALSLAASRQLAGVDGVISAIRSRRDLYYLAAYERTSDGVRRREKDALWESAPSFAAARSDWPLVGERPDWWSGRYAETAAADAEALLDVAVKMVANDEAVAVEAGLPEYFSGDSPWRKSG
jgi:tRNA threonylcarbamoyladenosine biosynthesis protein TsaB